MDGRRESARNRGLPPDARLWARVAKTDDCWLWTGACNDVGYGQIRIDGKLKYAHRFAYELLVGPIPPGMMLDHRHTCPKHCVNPEHLRLADKAQNAQNHVGPTRRSKSGIRGVYQHDCGKWYGQTKYRGKVHSTGLRNTPEEAASAVLELRRSLHTHNDLDR